MIGDEQSALDVIGDAFGEEAELVAVPVARLDPGFTRLASGVAGAVVQKFVNYRRAPRRGRGPWTTTASRRARGRLGARGERGRELWFVDDLDELDRRLSGART